MDIAEHGSTAGTDHDREVPEIDLLSPLKIRDLTLSNRIGMSPMCQYSSQEGLANDWHLVHLGSRAAGGASLIMVEATAVLREGRITPGDMGIWGDEHIEPLARIASFIKSQGAVPGIQLAHSGRKGSTDAPWRGGGVIREPIGWTPVAPSPLPFAEGDPVPSELDAKGIERVIQAFGDAAKRAVKAGFEVIEIHAAHGYLLHEFLSPISNRRRDAWGGSLENRIRLPVKIAESLRQAMPQGMPLFARISATDWVEGGFDIAQAVLLSKRLKTEGVDLIDVSTGGMVPKAHIPIGKGYQVPFARQIREEAAILTGAVGLITEVSHANGIITEGDADLILLGRELLREPYWAIKAQQELGKDPSWPVQYGYAVKRRAK